MIVEGCGKSVRIVGCDGSEVGTGADSEARRDAVCVSASRACMLMLDCAAGSADRIGRTGTDEELVAQVGGPVCTIA